MTKLYTFAENDVRAITQKDVLQLQHLEFDEAHSEKPRWWALKNKMFQLSHFRSKRLVQKRKP